MDKGEGPYGKIIQKSLRARVPAIESTSAYYWDSSFFSLSNLSLFENLSKERKENVLKSCSQSIIAEGIHIEDIGIDLTSFMIQKSNDNQEKHIYSLINADEIEHYYLLERFLLDPLPPASENPFITLLKECVQTSDSYQMVFFLQIILEGWGMTYYHDLEENCLDKNLKKDIKRILFDESSHHGTGLVYYQKSKRESDAQVKKMVEILASFLEMIRVGPQVHVSFLERELGGFTLNQKEKVFEKIGAQEDTTRRLLGIKKLLRHDLSNYLIAELEKRNLFAPYSPKEFARIS